MASIETTAATLKVSGITRTEITDIEQDQVTGDYVRELRTYEQVQGASARLVLVVQIRSSNRTGVTISKTDVSY